MTVYNIGRYMTYHYVPIFHYRRKKSVKLLDRLRHGQCNYDDYQLLLTRVARQLSVDSLHELPWNEVRIQLSNKATIHKATEKGQNIMIRVAGDTCKGKSIEDPALIDKFLELCDSKTEHLPGLLPFVPGMLAVITQNIVLDLYTP